MDEIKEQQKQERKALRREMAPLGMALLVYYVIFTACVSLVLILDTAILKANGGGSSQELLNNGTGYLLAVIIGLLCMRLWKGAEFCEDTLWTQGKPMAVKDFLALLALFLGGQMVLQILVVVLEPILNLMGMSLMSSLEGATVSGDTFTMFVYVGIAAPVAEELLFRGLVMRSLAPYGKRVAILLSAIVFGFFHGNLIQIPYAFVVGIILGYTAMEYNILWAMVLHMINNLVLADMIPRLTAALPAIVGSLIQVGIVYLCGLISVILLLVHRDDWGEYRRQNRLQGKYIWAFFTTPGMLGLMVVLVLVALSPLIMQLMGYL